MSRGPGAVAGRRRGRRRNGVAGRALVALALAASTAGWPSGAPAAMHTTASVYRAFSYHGLVVPHVTVATGYCWENSNVTRRSDAWRCLVGNNILDPCFSSAFAFGVVVCPHPWSDTGIEIELSRPLPRPTSHAAPTLALQPWAIETAAHGECLLASGASSVIRGHRLNYSCGPRLGLWGFPRRASQPWTILGAPVNATALTRRVAILHAWM